MRLSAALACCACLTACGAPAPRHPITKTTTKTTAKTLPQVVVDQGVFGIKLNGVDAGEEHFTITRTDGYTMDSTFEVSTAQLRVSSKNQIITDAAWRPRKASLVGTTNGVAFTETLTPGPPLTLDVDEGGQKRTLTAPRDVDALLADNSIVHMTAFCHRDAKAGTLLAFPGIETSISAAVPAGDDGKLVHRTVQASGQGQVEIYCDGDKLIAADAGAGQMTAVRRGDEARIVRAQPKARAKPTLPEGLVELERNVSVKAGKNVEAATLACSLVLPAAARNVDKRPAKGALPAALIVNDYGQEDRDGDTTGPGGVKLSLDAAIAIELGKAGIASLRCDDRGIGGSGGDFGKATLETFVADADAALTALRAEPAIDPKRIGLVGHGEGGVIAPMTAVDLPWLRAIAVLGVPGRPFDEILIEQDDKTMAKAGVPDDQRKTTREGEATISTAIKTGAPLPPNTQNAAQIEASRAWLQSEFLHDPIAAAAKVTKIPVFVGQADQDQSVTVHDAELVRDAMVKAGNKGVEYHLYAGLHHWFAPAITGDLADLVDPKAVIDARFLGDLVAFFHNHL
jgi:pimeloyl-ACP methyl ester carboxylesterase